MSNYHYPEGMIVRELPKKNRVKVVKYLPKLRSYKVRDKGIIRTIDRSHLRPLSQKRSLAAFYGKLRKRYAKMDKLTTIDGKLMLINNRDETFFYVQYKGKGRPRKVPIASTKIVGGQRVQFRKARRSEMRKD